MAFYLKKIIRCKAVIYTISLLSLSTSIFYLFFFGGAGVVKNAIENANLIQARLLPPFTAPPGNSKPIIIQNQFQRGDTIIEALKREGLDQDTAYTFFTTVQPVCDLKRIRAGKKYTLHLTRENNRLIITRFKYSIDEEQYLEVIKDPLTGIYISQVHTIPYEIKKEFIQGEIRDSLFTAIIEQGEKPELADILASLYDFDIDFNRDLRTNDSFALLIEKKYLNGRFVRYGNVLASEFTNRGLTTQVIRYTDPEGKSSYYHPDGRSVRKMFLRCPLPFMHVTSRYGNRRHPLSGFNAQHNGVDFAAPPGTPIRSTSAGIIQTISYNSIKGRYIQIRHKNGFVTHYYHLSRVKPGIKHGSRVEQGDVIGFVGSTGWSTGPHLHYGIAKHNQFINPLSLESPTKEPIKKEYMAHFRQYTTNIFLLMSGSHYVKIHHPVTEAVTKNEITPPLEPITSSFKH